MKRFLSLLLCLLLLLMPTAAFAAEDGAMQLFSWRQDGNMLRLLLYAKTDAYISAGDFIVRVNDSEVRADRLSGVGSDGSGTSWVVVLEPAVWDSIAKMGGSLVDSLAISLGENDNLAMVDAKTGEVLAFTRDATAIRRFADSALRVLSYGNGANKLNDAIHSALSLLKDSDAVREHKCLLVISEGIEKDSIYSLEQNCEDVERLAVTAYTVGIARDSTYAENFTKLSALSRRSPSGLALSYSEYRNETGPEAAKLIRDNEKYCYLLTVDLSGADIQNPSDARLSVELNGRVASQEHVALDYPEAAPHEHVYENATCQQPGVCSCGEVDPSGTLADHSYGEDGRCVWCGQPPKSPLLAWVKDNLLLCIMCAALFVLLLVLLIVLIVRRRRSRDDVLDDNGGGTIPVGGNGGSGGGVTGYPGSTMPITSKVTVELTNKATGEKFTGTIRDSTLKAGRSAELNLTGDGAISREHMEFVWQNGILYVQDANATNGTLVNGIQIHGAIPLHQNDVIHAGESDFYVTWRSNR